MDDLISEFITETSESIQLLDSELVKLEQDPNNEQILSNIFRLVHTIKGTCGFLGLPRLEAVAHASENVLGKIRDKIIIVSPDAISFVLESLDSIKTIIEYLGSNGDEPAGDDADLIKRLNAFAESNGNVIAAVQPKTATIAASDDLIEEPKLNVAIETPVVAIEKPVEPRNAKEAAILEGLAVEAKERKDANEANSNVSQNQSIRVSIDVLENLMQMVGELVLTRNQLLQIVRARNDAVFAAPLQHLSHITSELQEGIMKTRMQPISNAWSKFPRLIRDLSHELGKKIDLRMIGAETELDRQLLEMIKDPLTHMVRNSADHGLENPAERLEAGKSETGTVTLSAYHEGGHIIIDIADDGRGLNIDRIKKKIVENNLASDSELSSLSDQQIMQYIFRAGFSTAEKVTSVSGRGVGMDVVRTNIERIGGTIELSSILGKGSKFSIKIPLTLAIVSVLLVEAGGEKFALPQLNVQELVRAGGDAESNIEHINNSLVLRLRDKLLPLVSLSEILGMQAKQDNDNITFIAVCKVGGYNFGLIVDKVFDTEEIVVKPTSQLLKDIPLYSGNTILGDGSVIMILDPNGIARATGEREIAGGRDVVDDLKKNLKDNKLINFLVFRTEHSTPKAVPLELVSRLEEIDMEKVEMSGEHPVVQYRGDLMRLRKIGGGEDLPNTGIKDVIVFTYDNKTLGLVVEEIIDIVNAVYDIKLVAAEKGFLGSMVIEGKTTDIVDVAYLIADLVNNEDSSEKIGKAAKLLLVEDSPFFRSLTVPFLASAGYKVTAVASAKEALAILEENQKFDVIVSDIEMPEMDGFEFAEICSNKPKLSHIPLFAFTSTKNAQSLQRAEHVGFKDVILKTNRADLLRAIAEVLHLEEKESI